MKDNGMKYISDAFRAVEIMRTNVGMPMDRLFAVVLPHSAKEVMEEPHIRLLNQSYISVLSDIGRIRPVFVIVYAGWSFMVFLYTLKPHYHNMNLSIY